MANSSCPSCGTAIPDPAWRFCPACGSRVGALGQGRLPVQPTGSSRIIPALAIAAGIVLVIAGMVVLVPVLPLPPVPLHAAADAGNIVHSAAPELPGAPGNGTVPALSPTEQDATASTSIPGPQDNTTTTTPAPSRTHEVTGPVPTVSETPANPYRVTSAGSGPERPAIDAASLAARVHERINGQRQVHGLPALGHDPGLASLARAHSTDMAAHGYFGHVNLQERDPTARGAAAGYSCSKDYDSYYTYGIAENIFATYRYVSVIFHDNSAVGYDWKTEEAIAEETVDAWMNSPDHRDNILDKGMLREGIGVAVSNDGLVFVTEDFC